ncbi:amidase [Aureobasidium subglaciale]|nr:amidase [Aureobasidium subglaciale]KAI5232976.1 amidase [Aureobasidium subglaciale]
MYPNLDENSAPEAVQRTEEPNDTTGEALASETIHERDAGYENLDELAGPAPEQNPEEGSNYRHSNLEDEREGEDEEKLHANTMGTLVLAFPQAHLQSQAWRKLKKRAREPEVRALKHQQDISMSWIEISRRKQEALRNSIPPEWRLPASRIADAATCLDVSGLVSAELSYNERLITQSDVADILTSIATGEMTSFEVMSAHCHRAAVAHQLLGETTNNIVGSTVNPYNSNFSAGGACGGEGALIALRGSPLGLATDMGKTNQSLPALSLIADRDQLDRLASLLRFVGLGGYTLMDEQLPGLPVGSGSIGLISRDPQSIQHVIKLLLDSAPWSSNCDVLEMPWRQEKLDAVHQRATPMSGRLVFAMMKDDGHLIPDLPTKQALTTTEQALKLCGHEIVEWKPPSHKIATEILFQLFGSTSAKCIRDAIDASGEPPVDQLKEWYHQTDSGSLPTEDFWKLCEELQGYKRSYMKYWLAMGAKTASGRAVDGVIMPVSPHATTQEGTDRYFGYTAVANALDHTSCTFPVTGRGSVLDIEPNKFSGDHSQGLPVGLQVMCGRLQEEKVLALVQAIKQSLVQAYNHRGD